MKEVQVTSHITDLSNLDLLPQGHIIIYHNRIFDLRAGAEASSTSVGP